jgi:hypothetical protein
MPLSFPASPTVGQTSTQNGRQYVWTGYAWELVAASGGGGSGLTWSAVPASPTASGNAGSIAYDGSYFYLASATNTWRRAAISPWYTLDPTSITGLQLWLDASDGTSLYDETSGGSPVVATGMVRRWLDKSGNGRHAIESTNGPTRRINVQNGLSTLDFDGTNDTLQIPSSQSTFAFLHQSSQATVFCVYRPTYASLAGNEFHGILDTGSRSGLTPGVQLSFNNNNSQGIDWRVNGVDQGSGTFRVISQVASGAPNNSFLLVAIVTDNENATTASRALMYRNGGSASGTVVGSPFDSGGVSAGNSGRNFTISGSGTATGASTSQFFNGDIGEIIIYNSALSDDDRTAVNQYLMSKWGIA